MGDSDDLDLIKNIMTLMNEFVIDEVEFKEIKITKSIHVGESEAVETEEQDEDTY